MSALKDKLARAWAEDLQARVPSGHRVYAMRRDADAEPPFSVVTVMRMEQTVPGADVWLADVKAVVVCDRSQGGTLAQERRCAELYAALEATVPGVDADKGVVLHGFSVDTVESAKAEQVYSDVIFITAGVGKS
jgi:hypothetical protein